ncbi:MAG: Inosine-5'-monophosphate dehydrogenase, partial [Candidatus Woesebacteria bacterium GW2011_GWB1_41_10]
VCEKTKLIHVVQKIQLGLSYDDVLLIPQYSEVGSRNDVDLSSKLTSKITLKIPIISANMSNVTGSDMAISIGKIGGLGVIPRFMSQEDEANLVSKVKKQKLTIGAAIGIRNGMFGRAETLLKAGADILFLDVAHGHMQKVLEAVSEFKNKYPKVDLVAGNVATYDAAVSIFTAGADSIKVGIGPGSICTTRIVTGSGVPQITAIMEASKAARRVKKTLIADGGAKNSGDIVKGLAAGASCLMLGNLLAGTDQSPGKKIKINGKWFKSYNASTSRAEKKNHIRTNGDEFEKHYIKQIEGVESLIPYKGPLSGVIENLISGVRSGLSYSGSNNIPVLWNKAKFIQITNLGLKESLPHDVINKYD